MTSRADTLDAAKAAVMTDRAATHGAPEQTFAAIAALWSARLGQEITPAQVCILLIDLKTARAWGNPRHADNWVDAAGYAACGGEVAAPQVDLDAVKAEADEVRRYAPWPGAADVEPTHGPRLPRGGSVVSGGRK